MKATSHNGYKFNKLTIVSDPYPEIYGNRKRKMVDAVCECGTDVKCTFQPISQAYPKSCGCAQLIFKDRAKAAKMRSSFEAMHRRCNDTAGEHFKHYKAKGITVCKRWEKFPAFYEDMQGSWFLGGELDRYPDKHGNYEPVNVRWATEEQQQRNKDSVKLNEVTVKEIRESGMKQEELAKKYGVGQHTISKVINHKRWKNI